MLETIERAAKIIGIAVAVFGVWKYFDELHQKTINKSFAYYDEYNGDRYLGIKSILGQITLEAYDAEGVEEFEEVVHARLGEPDNRIAYNEAASFFDRVYRCVQVGHCDKATAINLLQHDARKLGTPFLSFMREVAAKEPKHGVGLVCIWTAFEKPVCTEEK